MGALKDCCSEIIAKDPRWASMVTGVRTTGTVGVQLWIKKSLADLGFDLAEWGLEPRPCARRTR